MTRSKTEQVRMECGWGEELVGAREADPGPHCTTRAQGCHLAAEPLGGWAGVWVGVVGAVRAMLGFIG